MRQGKKILYSSFHVKCRLVNFWMGMTFNMRYHILKFYSNQLWNWNSLNWDKNESVSCVLCHVICCMYEYLIFTLDIRY